MPRRIYITTVLPRSTAQVARALIIAGFFLAFVSAGRTLPRDRASELKKECGLSPDVNPQYFANVDGNHWSKYRNAKNFSKSKSDWAEYATVWVAPGSPAFVEIDGFGQDFINYTYYCYDGVSGVAAVEHEFRTAWGWAFWETDSFAKNVSTSHTEIS